MTNATDSHWTAARTERAKDLWDAGLSAAQIAGDLGGVTRNAVIGKLHRLGLMKPKARIRQAVAADRQMAKRLARKPQERRKPLPAPKTAPAIKTAPVPFLGQTTGLCKYPLWDDPRPPVEERMVCGAPAKHGPWCEAHRAICFTPGSILA